MEACLELLRAVSSSVLVGFDSNKSELGKMYVEAKDNVRFLMTLERHFKNITAGKYPLTGSETVYTHTGTNTSSRQELPANQGLHSAHDECATNGLDHFAPLQQRRPDGPSDGAHSVAVGTEGASHSQH